MHILEEVEEGETGRKRERPGKKERNKTLREKLGAEQRRGRVLDELSKPGGPQSPDYSPLGNM